MELGTAKTEQQKKYHMAYNTWKRCCKMSTLTECFLLIAGRETVKKELMQSGVRPSVHVAEVFSCPRTARFVHRFGLTPGLANRMGLERPSSTCKNVVTFATQKANFDCW